MHNRVKYCFVVLCVIACGRCISAPQQPDASKAAQVARAAEPTAEAMCTESTACTRAAEEVVEAQVVKETMSAAAETAVKAEFHVLAVEEQQAEVRRLKVLEAVRASAANKASRGPAAHPRPEEASTDSLNCRAEAPKARSVTRSGTNTVTPKALQTLAVEQAGDMTAALKRIAEATKAVTARMAVKEKAALIATSARVVTAEEVASRAALEEASRRYDRPTGLSSAHESIHKPSNVEATRDARGKGSQVCYSDQPPMTRRIAEEMATHRCTSYFCDLRLLLS